MSKREEVYARIEQRRQRLIEGKVNSIPSPFVKFSNDFIGWEQGVYYLISSFTKGGKSQLVSYLLFEAIMFLYENLKAGKNIDLDIKILWFPLEETEDKIILRFMSWLLNRMTNYKMRYSPRDLQSSKNDKILPQEVLDFMNKKEFTDIVDFFESKVIFSNEKNPTGIWKAVKNYCEDNGTVYRKEVPIKDESGNPHMVQAFDKYVPNNPSQYVFALVDTVNLIDLERGFNKKQSIDKMSEYAISLRNRYNVSPIFIQQQNADNESIDSIKYHRTRPTTAGLGDSKYTSHDANVVLGIFSPFRFGLKEYLGYPIDKLKDHYRTLEILVNREGEVGGIVSLFFDGATCNWFELPSAKDTVELNKVYAYLNRIKINPNNPVSPVLLTVYKYNNKIKQAINKALLKLHGYI